jgi:hypothetical protein
LNFKFCFYLTNCISNVLSLSFKVAHPNIFSFINALKKEEVNSGVSYYKALNGEEHPQRKKLHVTKDETLNTNA